jgi:hypothetical protein
MRFQSLERIATNSRQKLEIIHQNAQYLSNKTELFTAFLQSTTPNYDKSIVEHSVANDPSQAHHKKSLKVFHQNIRGLRN